LFLHLLFGNLFGCGSDGGLVVTLGSQTVDDLVNNGGGVCLFVESEGVCSDGRLALLDSFLCGFEVVFEVGQGFVDFWFAVPLLDVACKDGGPGDDDETNVDELGCDLCSFSGFCLVGVVVDGSEDVHDGPGVVVGFYFHFGFCGGKGLRSDGSVGVEEFLYDLMNRSFKESGFIVN
jgi:hypothetical protein